MPKIILSKICVRCNLEKPTDEFRLANRKITNLCKTCRSKCIVCGSLIQNSISLQVKYCSDECRRVADRLQKAERQKRLSNENPNYFKEQYALKKAKGLKTYDPDYKRQYHQARKDDPEYRLKRLNYTKSYYYRNRDEILKKKAELGSEQRDAYNSKIREWRKQRLENMSPSDQEKLKQHFRTLNRQTRARQRLAKLRLDFAKIEELNNE